MPANLQLIALKSVYLAESATWPRFTLLGQILGSIVLGFETMLRFRPDILVDTAGFPFIYPIIKLFNCKLVAYVHYPFISNDMIQKLQSKSYNNSNFIANNFILRNSKIIYYRLLIRIYSFCGICCDLALTNSSWTNGHIIRSWIGCPLIKIVYPPCDLSPFTERKDFIETRYFGIKNTFAFTISNKLQLEIASLVLKQIRVKDLKDYAKQLGISESV